MKGLFQLSYAFVDNIPSISKLRASFIFNFDQIKTYFRADRKFLFAITGKMLAIKQVNHSSNR